MDIKLEKYLDVDEMHKIYYEIHGNPNGEKIIFLHGGPGLGSTKEDLKYFNLKKVTVILMDQRGSGKSIPYGELRNNNTQNLVTDINQLLLHLKLDQVFLFGGSWGSTLSLLFGIKYPNKVKGMILRGVFTATLKERCFFEQGGIKSKFPKIWNRLKDKVPINHRSNVLDYYFKNILFGDNQFKELLSYELCYYGYSLSSKENKLSEKKIEQKIKNNNYKNRAKILSHYSINNFFLSENYIENNISKLSNIPIRIIHGLDDQITLSAFAVELSSKIEMAKLKLVDGGHSSNDKNIKIELVRAVEEMIN